MFRPWLSKTHNIKENDYDCVCDYEYLDSTEVNGYYIETAHTRKHGYKKQKMNCHHNTLNRPDSKVHET